MFTTNSLPKRQNQQQNMMHHHQQQKYFQPANNFIGQECACSNPSHWSSTTWKNEQKNVVNNLKNVHNNFYQKHNQFEIGNNGTGFYHEQFQQTKPSSFDFQNKFYNHNQNYQNQMVINYL